MKKVFTLWEMLFGEELEIRHKLMNLILCTAIVGGIISLIATIVIDTTSIPGIVLILTLIIFGFICVWISVVKKNLNLSSILMCIMGNVIVFPAMFFLNGGIFSGMPLWFLLGLIFSWLILKGKVCYIMYGVNVIIMSFCLLISIEKSDWVFKLNDNYAIAVDIIQSLIITSCIIGVVFKFQTYVYEKKRRNLAKKERELRRVMVQLEKANRAKSGFLANMSHEIRTPINAILGMDEMILRESEDENILEYAKNIQSAGHTLISLINDILDLSKIESGKLEIVPVEYDLFSLINDAYTVVRMRAEEKKLKLYIKNNESIPYKLYGDEIRVRQIIYNLITNAVKYTKEGSITIDIDWQPRENEYMDLIVSVKDTGIGISDENMKNLFDSFARFDLERNRNIEGTGLGLTIVKLLLDLMKGEMEVESVYGQGSTFKVTIPQKIISSQPMGDFYKKYNNKGKEIYNEILETDEYLEAPNLKILVVDDVAMNLEVVAALLKRSKIQVDKAMSGKECLEKVKEKKYDIIFLDHMMPEMDGIETYVNMKAMEDNLNQDTPVIALTANAIIGSKEQYLDAGFNDYLSKPVKGKEIEAMIKKYTQ